MRSLGWYESDTSICIAMEYFPLGDLAHHLSNASPLSKDDVQPILHQLLEGLSILHENGFAHRDLKPGVRLVIAEASRRLELTGFFLEYPHTVKKSVVGQNWRLWDQ